MKLPVRNALSGQHIANPGKPLDRVHGVSEPRSADGKVRVTTDSGRNWMDPDTVVEIR